MPTYRHLDVIAHGPAAHQLATERVIQEGAVRFVELEAAPWGAETERRAQQEAARRAEVEQQLQEQAAQLVELEEELARLRARRQVAE